MPHPPAHLETLLAFDPLDGLAELEDRLEGLRGRAAAAGIAFDRHAVRNELQAATFRLRNPCDVRLLVSDRGTLAIEMTPRS